MDLPFLSPRFSHHRQQRHNDHGHAVLVEPRAEVVTVTFEASSVAAGQPTLLLASVSTSPTSSSSAFLVPTILSAASFNVSTSSSSSVAAASTSNPTHTESHATHVNAGTIAAMQSLMITFGLFFLFYALVQLPSTIVRLSRGGWRSGWAFSTRRPPRRHKMKISNPHPVRVDGDDAEEVRVISNSSTNLVPVGLSEKSYNEGWSGPSLRPATPLQRTMKRTIFPAYTWRVPLLNFDLKGAALFVPFLVVVICTCVIKSNYLWDATRTGFVPLAMLPFVFSLGWKTCGLGTILQVGYASLASLHRWLARLCVFITTIHIIAYCIVFDKNGTWSIQMRDIVNIEAWYGYGGMCIMVLAGCGPIRRRWYRLFKVSHHVGLILFLAGMNYHSRSVLPYLLVAICCTAVNYAYRFLTNHFHVAELTPVRGANSTIVFVPSVKTGWFPGQHVRIRVLSGGMGFLGLESHPFTIASAVGSSDGLRLIIKSNGDWTGSLFRAAGGYSDENEVDEDASLPKRVVMEVGGPYGQVNFIPSTFQSVLIVVGGSGVSYALSVLEGIVQDCLKGDGRSADVELVWTVRESALLQHTLPYFQDILTGALSVPTLNITIRLFCTAQTAPPRSRSHSLEYLRDVCVAPQVTYGQRPDVKMVLDSLAERTRVGGGLAVCACGPQGMVDGVAKMVDGMHKGRKASIGVECSIELFSL